MKLLHFTADWCQPCKMIKPKIDKYINSHPEIEYVRVDIEEDFETAKEFNVMGIPTLVVINDGVVINRHVGMADDKKIESLFEIK